MKNKFLNVTLLVIILAVVLFYITAQFIQPSPKKDITIATGSTTGLYYKTAIK